MGSPSGLVFIHLLADKGLQPLGAQFVLGTGSAAALGALLTSEPGKSLIEQIQAAQCACLLSQDDAASLPVDIAELTQQVGFECLNGETLCRVDGPGAPAFAPAAKWVDGLWYLTPPAKPRNAQAASKVMALKLVQLVSADADTCEIEDVFRQDPTLSYHRLRLVNSLAFGASRRISSFSQAILMLGRQQLKRWLNLILFAAGADDPRAPMLLGHVVVRARMMELLTQETGSDKAQQELAFMAGMFSMLGVLFGQPLEEVFKPLQLDETLQAAVLAHQGPIGQMLQVVESAQARDEGAVSEWLVRNGVSADVFNRLMLTSVQWMLGMRQEGSDD